MFFKSFHETLIKSRIETVGFFHPTKGTVQGTSKNKRLRRSVEYGKNNILRAEERA